MKSARLLVCVLPHRHDLREFTTNILLLSKEQDWPGYLMQPGVCSAFIAARSRAASCHPVVNTVFVTKTPLRGEKKITIPTEAQLRFSIFNKATMVPQPKRRDLSQSSMHLLHWTGVPSAKQHQQDLLTSEPGFAFLWCLNHQVAHIWQGIDRNMKRFLPQCVS